MRFHAPHLETKFPSLHLTVKEHMKWYVGRVQNMYPTLIHVKYNLLLSKPNAPEQGLHFDYMDHTTKKNPEQQPVSLIVAIDPFLLVTAQDSTAPGMTYRVQSGSCIIFSNKVQHAGGKNIHQVDGKPAHAVRMFAYMVSDEKDFPGDNVTYFLDDGGNSSSSGSSSNSSSTSSSNSSSDSNSSGDESESDQKNKDDGTSNNNTEKPVSEHGQEEANDTPHPNPSKKSGSSSSSSGSSGTSSSSSGDESESDNKNRDDGTSDNNTFCDNNLKNYEKPVSEDGQEEANNTPHSKPSKNSSGSSSSNSSSGSSDTSSSSSGDESESDDKNRDDGTSNNNTFCDNNLKSYEKPVSGDGREEANNTPHPKPSKKRHRDILESNNDESNRGEESSVPIPIPANDSPSLAIHHLQGSSPNVSVHPEAIRLIRNFTSTHNSLPSLLPPAPSGREQIQDFIQRMPLVVRRSWIHYTMEQRMNRAAKKR